MRLTPILIIIGIAIIIATGFMLMQPSHILAQTSGATCKMQIVKSHKFSLCYGTTNVFASKLGPRWNMTVIIQAAPEQPQVLEQIEKVVYSYQRTANTMSSPITTTSKTNNFALNLTVYAGPLVNAKVYFKDGQNGNQSIQTFTKCPSSAINFCNTLLHTLAHQLHVIILKNNEILSVSTTSSNIQSDTQITFFVAGKLSYLNGTAIPGQQIDIKIFSVGNNSRVAPLNYTTLPTLNDGTYQYNIPLPGLLAGDYKVIVRPEGKYALVTNSSHLAVTPHPLTFDQYIGYLVIITAIGGSVLGGFMKIPPYISEKKHAKMLRNCILDINNKYDKYMHKQIGLDQYLNDLENLRSSYMNMVASRDIAEDQYKMLDDMISSYSNRAHQQEPA